jgi:hypothetical protein
MDDDLHKMASGCPSGAEISWITSIIENAIARGEPLIDLANQESEIPTNFANSFLENG